MIWDKGFDIYSGEYLDAFGTTLESQSPAPRTSARIRTPRRLPCQRRTTWSKLYDNVIQAPECWDERLRWPPPTPA